MHAQPFRHALDPECHGLHRLAIQVEGERLRGFDFDPRQLAADGHAVQRGILAWDFDLAPGRKQTVTLEHTLSWPKGMELR